MVQILRVCSSSADEGPCQITSNWRPLTAKWWMGWGMDLTLGKSRSQGSNQIWVRDSIFTLGDIGRQSNMLQSLGRYHTWSVDERLPVRLCGCMIVFMDPVLRTALLQEGVFLLAILVLIKWGMMKVSEYCRLEQVEWVETGHVPGACTREEWGLWRLPNSGKGIK